MSTKEAASYLISCFLVDFHILHLNVNVAFVLWYAGVINTCCQLVIYLSMVVVVYVSLLLLLQYMPDLFDFCELFLPDGETFEFRVGVWRLSFDLYHASPSCPSNPSSVVGYSAFKFLNRGVNISTTNLLLERFRRHRSDISTTHFGCTDECDDNPLDISTVIMSELCALS